MAAPDTAPDAVPTAAPSTGEVVSKVKELKWKLRSGLCVVFGSANKTSKADGSFSFSSRLARVSPSFTVRVNAKSALARDLARAAGKTDAPRTQVTFHLNRAKDKVLPLEEVVKAYRRSGHKKGKGFVKSSLDEGPKGSHPGAGEEALVPRGARHLEVHSTP